jgi:hypothetical protein
MLWGRRRLGEGRVAGICLKEFDRLENEFRAELQNAGIVH